MLLKTNNKVIGIGGFSIVEGLIAITILCIGFLGMAGVMIRSIQAQHINNMNDASLKLARGKSGQLGQIDFALLGAGTTAAENEMYGAPGQAVTVVGPVNKKGELSSVSGALPPYSYTVSHVVCKDDANGGASAASASGDPCGAIATTRPADLSCNVALTTAGQAIVRVLVTYRDQGGKCHKVALDRMNINFD